ncbi:mechanosensitive ion channel family protein [Rubidibacter lacunae]|nr:mechanosensitive ion channel family protein [Rubidibacter lacunae]
MSESLETIRDSLQDLIGRAVELIPGILAALIVLALTAYAAKAARDIGSKAGMATANSASLRLLIEQTCYIATWAGGVLFAAILAFPGLQLGDVIAALGLGTVAIGFAFQDIFKNFLAGILLLLQEPFEIGDQIVVSDYEGVVEHIDIRTTSIRTYQGERVLVPNSTIFTNPVQVRTAYSSRRSDLGVGVDYNTPLSDTASLLERIICQVEGVLPEPEPSIDLVCFNDSSIDFVVRYWTLPQMKEVCVVQTRAILAIKREFDRANITIPYPIRTLYYFDQEKYNDYLPAGDGNTTPR